MAHADLDNLLNFCLSFAQQQLAKRAGFLPFAAKVGADGKLNPLAIYDGEEYPQPQELIKQYEQLLSGLASTGEAQAMALCHDSFVRSSDGAGGKSDAIAVALEHSNGECVMVYLPYRKRFLLGYAYGELIAQAGEKRFFA